MKSLKYLLVIVITLSSSNCESQKNKRKIKSLYGTIVSHVVFEDEDIPHLSKVFPKINPGNYYELELSNPYSSRSDIIVIYTEIEVKDRIKVGDSGEFLLTGERIYNVRDSVNSSLITRGISFYKLKDTHYEKSKQ